MKKKIIVGAFLLLGAFGQVAMAQTPKSGTPVSRTHKCYVVTFRGSYDMYCGSMGVDCIVQSDCPIF